MKNEGNITEKYEGKEFSYPYMATQPQTTFNFFKKEMKKALGANYSGQNYILQKWNQLTLDQKAPFNEMRKADKERKIKEFE